MSAEQFKIEWNDSGREPQMPPNPQFPRGIDLDASGEAIVSCLVKLPYPARRCGYYEIECACGTIVVCTTAGRPDDPRSVRLACKRK